MTQQAPRSARPTFSTRTTFSTRITFEDIQRCAPPPGWTRAHQVYHERAWHRVQAATTTAPLPTAQQWQQYFAARRPHGNP